MKTDIVYRDISRTDGLEQYILEHTEDLIQSFFINDEQAHLTVIINKERQRKEARKPAYICELLLKPTHTKKIIKVLKTDDDFKVCVAKSMEALKTIVRKEHDRKAKHGQR